MKKRKKRGKRVVSLKIKCEFWAETTPACVG